MQPISDRIRFHVQNLVWPDVGYLGSTYKAEMAETGPMSHAEMAEIRPRSGQYRLSIWEVPPGGYWD